MEDYLVQKDPFSGHRQLRKKSVGLFGGSFNPIHIGHIHLALELREKGGLDEIWFVPASLSPFKQDEKGVSPFCRSQMVKLAIEEIPEFIFCDYEMQKGGISYTIDTIHHFLQEKGDNYTFTLCLASDVLPHFHKWKNYEEIVAQVPLLIGLRGGEEVVDNPFVSSKVSAILKKSVIKTALFEISGTLIRERIKKRLYCGHLVSHKVLDFIYENQLYFNE